MIGTRSPTGIVVAGAVVMCCSLSSAAVIYVDDSAIGGANNGTSWSNAFVNLQSALAIAHAGDEIRIGQGTYKPAPPGGDRAISFNLVSGVVMQGGYAGLGGAPPDLLDPMNFPTTLSGNINNTPLLPGGCNLESHYVIRGDGLASGTEVRGCIIERGCALAVPDFDQMRGGGMRIEGASRLTVADCVFRDNWARLGGGVYLSAQTAAQFQNCRFINNRLSFITSSGGGGAYAGGSATFIDCEFLSNSGAGSGGALYGTQGTDALRCQFVNNFGEVGGAITGAGLLRECLFQGNVGHFGGAVYGAHAIVNCTFLDNYAEFSAGAASNFHLAANCTFMGNSVEGPGGAVLANGATLINCTLVGNRLTLRSSPSNGGTAVAVINSSAKLLNCVVWDNADPVSGTAAPPIWLNGATIDIHNCTIQGWTGSLGGVGNHGNDPRFVDPDGPDNIYGTPDDNPHLRANSPCIDSGDRALLPPDTFDLDRDGDTAEPLPLDLDFRPRIAGSNVDMGAFEFHGHACRADIDGSGSVGVSDLLAVLTGWGNCASGSPCPADLDLNMRVNVDDLLAIITHWGPCP